VVADNHRVDLLLIRLVPVVSDAEVTGDLAELVAGLDGLDHGSLLFCRASTARCQARAWARTSAVDGTTSANQPTLCHASASRPAWRSERMGPVQPGRPSLARLRRT